MKAKSVMTQAREYLGYSLKDVGDRLGVPISRLRQFESGKAIPGPALLSILARLYGRDEADLLKPGPDEASFAAEDSTLEDMAKDLPVEDQMELAMFSGFLRNRKRGVKEATP